ncbi:MAG TPA: LysM peptidoglycan-binding domain-containing protein [Verrucomicrobiae bacterium]|jgi:LysM repeat protein|nr:LysM peptidoglycan-binding domain-containing protein [Verrucomicrobiae bacterium]
MNNPNPFVPQGSLEHNKRRSRMKLGVFCVLAIGVAGLTAMLIQGCKRETETADNTLVDTNAIDTNTPTIDTNAPPLETSNPPVMTPAVTPPVETAGTEYIIVKGDTLGKIAKDHHVTLRELEAANPNLQPTKLKVGDKLTIPAGTGGATATETTSTTSSEGEEVYTVKSGDTLTKIAKTHGTTIKAIESENNLSTTKIKVGQKLKIPASTSAAPMTAPTDTNASAPVTVPVAPIPNK